MKTFLSEDGLSEVIGFILLIGLLVVFLVLYQTYSIPVQGRDNEIDHMNDIKDTFAAYKISLDSLWLNEREGTMLSTTVDLGTGGGYSRGGPGEIGFLAPVTSGGSLGTNQRNETINVTGIFKGNGSRVTFIDANPGSLEYLSNNNYWIDQNYYYQLGGVFLEQDSGSTVRLMPPLDIVETAYQGNLSDTRPEVDFTIIRLDYQELISGSGPIRIDSKIKKYGLSDVYEDDYETITISVESDDPNTRLMWAKLFRDLLVENDVAESWYTITNENDVVSLEMEDFSTHGVHGSFILANYSVALQTVATNIE